jgi:hypothetical protein
VAGNVKTAHLKCSLKATVPLAPVGESPLTGNDYYVNIGVDKFFYKLPSYLNTKFYFYQILFDKNMNIAYICFTPFVSKYFKNLRIIS